MRRWSRLQKRIYDLMDPKANLQIHMSLYEMNSNDGWHGNKLPRFFITVGKEIVVDYPKDYDTGMEGYSTTYPWLTDIQDISNLLDEYTKTPKERLLQDSPSDLWGIMRLLSAADRRIGKRRLMELYEASDSQAVKLIIENRLKKENT